MLILITYIVKRINNYEFPFNVNNENVYVELKNIIFQLLVHVAHLAHIFLLFRYNQKTTFIETYL